MGVEMHRQHIKWLNRVGIYFSQVTNGGCWASSRKSSVLFISVLNLVTEGTYAPNPSRGEQQGHCYISGQDVMFIIVSESPHRAVNCWPAEVEAEKHKWL
jgi:hypothetical protein